MQSRGPDQSHEIAGSRKNAGFDPNLHRHAFEKFIAFLTYNLRGQTTLRIDPHWASQTALLRSYSAFCPTDMIIREDELQTLLPFLAQLAGYKTPPNTRIGTRGVIGLAHGYLRPKLRKSPARYLSTGLSVIRVWSLELNVNQTMAPPALKRLSGLHRLGLGQ